MQGIKFSPDLVPLVDNGTKDVTRRGKGLKLINQSPNEWKWVSRSLSNGKLHFIFRDSKGNHLRVIAPFGTPKLVKGQPLGVKPQLVYVKEVYQEVNGVYFYRATYPNKHFPYKWKSSMYMPAKAARMFLQLIDIYPERLHDITDEDAVREGAKDRQSFFELWDSIYHEGSNELNPWVFRIEYKKV